jgi:hypothetical protein
MAIPRSFEELVSHPAPGLHFPPHELAGTVERIVPSAHRFGDPASAKAIRTLRTKTAACPEAQSELLEFFSRWDGANLCCLPDPLNGGLAPALSILPVAAWDEFTSELVGEDLNWMFDGLEEMYVLGRFLVIAATDSECTRLVLFTGGQFDGIDLSGKVFYVSMDPVLGFTEPVAGSFHQLLHSFAADPAAFLSRIGFTSVVAKGEHIYGDVADRYLPDCGEAG